MLNLSRSTACVAALIVAAALAAPAAAAVSSPQGPARTVSIDRDAYADDTSAVAALQSAIDAGGDVVVNGTFVVPFGQSLFVGRYGNDVAIRASKDGATLVGGTRTLSQIAPVRMTVSGIAISASQASYIYVGQTSGSTVRDCVMTGLQRLAGAGTVGLFVDRVPAAAAPVDVVVEDNLIDAGDAQWTMTAMNNAVVVNGVVAELQATIRGNRIQAAQTAGIFVNDSAGDYAIEKNHVSLQGQRDRGPFLWSLGIWGRSASRAMASFTVTNNDVDVMNSVAAIGYGNFLVDAAQPPNVLVANNRVRIVSGVLSVLLLHGNVDGSTWRHNVITGSAPNAVALIPAGFGIAESNLFQQNAIEIALLDAQAHPMFPPVPESHVYFGVGANDNLARGCRDLSVVDLGVGNTIR